MVCGEARCAMIICSCNVVSDCAVRAALEAAGDQHRPRTPSAVFKCLGHSPNCGRCFATVRRIIGESAEAHAERMRRCETCEANPAAHQGLAGAIA